MADSFKKWWLLTILVFMGSFLVSARAQAAAAQITIQKSQQDIVKGDTFYVVVTVTSDEEINGFEGYFSYNQNVMQFITGGSIASGNDDEIHIKDLDRETGTKKIKYSLQFRARKAGTSSVALKRYRQIKKAEEETKLSVGSASLEIEVVSRKEHEAKIKKQKDQQMSQRPAETEEEPAESPELTPAPGADLNIPSPDMAESKTGALEDVSNQTDVSSEIEESSRESGLTKKICLVILVLAVTGFVIVAALLVNALQETGDEEETVENSDRMNAEDVDQDIEDPDEIDLTDQEKSLEEIEKRLEEKRRWLRKE